MSGEPTLGERVSGAGADRLRAELEGRFVRLRAIDPENDAGELYPASHGSRERERLWTYMAYGPFSSSKQMQEWLRGCAACPDPLFLCVMEAGTGRRLGMAAFMNVRPAMRVVELGHIWYRPEAQRTRANTEAAYLMLREAFARGYRRVEWKCDALNERSREAAVRLGFAFEGVFRQHMIVKGRNRDTAWYALLDRDWPRLRANLERWLEAPAGSLSLAALNGGGASSS